MTTNTVTKSPALLFEGGFRIFFLAAAIYAVISMIAWVLYLTGYSEIIGETSALPGSLWHAHELVFGFIMAVVAGFLTTAVPVWTGSPRIRGYDLTLLFVIWLAGRVFTFGSELLPLGLSAAVDLSFIPLLAFIIGRQIVAKKLWRNLGFIPLLLAIFIGNALIWGEMFALPYASATMGIRLSIGLLVLMTVLIGGRILPVFTNNWLKRNGIDVIVKSAPWITRLTILSTLLAVIGYAFDVVQPYFSFLTAAAGSMILIRVFQWKSWLTLSDPLMWIIHLGYILLGLGFLAEASIYLFEDFPEILANHVLSIGGIGIMVLGMMSRIALGHTGRSLEISPWIKLSFGLLILSLIARLAPPLFFYEYEELGLSIAGASWVGAWVLYLIIYIPVLGTPRADGKAG